MGCTFCTKCTRSGYKLDRDTVWRNKTESDRCTNVKAKCTRRRPREVLSPKQKEHLEGLIGKYRYANTCTKPRLYTAKVVDKVIVVKTRKEDGTWKNVTKKM